jgi:hypothetical protein
MSNPTHQGTCLIWHIKEHWDHKFLSDVTWCRKTHMSDYTRSTVVYNSSSMNSNNLLSIDYNSSSMNSNNPLLIDCKTFICTKLNNIQIYHVCDGYLWKIPVERRKISRAEWRGKFSLKTGMFNYTEYYLEHWLNK